MTQIYFNKTAVSLKYDKKQKQNRSGIKYERKICPWGLMKVTHSPANIYLFKVNNRNTRKKVEICSKLTIKNEMMFLL